MGDALSAAIDSSLILSRPFVTAGFSILSILGTWWSGSPRLPLPLSELSTLSSLCRSNSCSKARSYPFQAHVFLQICFPTGTFCFVRSNLLVFPRQQYIVSDAPPPPPPLGSPPSISGLRVARIPRVGFSFSMAGAGPAWCVPQTPSLAFSFLLLTSPLL